MVDQCLRVCQGQRVRVSLNNGTDLGRSIEGDLKSIDVKSYEIVVKLDDGQSKTLDRNLSSQKYNLSINKLGNETRAADLKALNAEVPMGETTNTNPNAIILKVPYQGLVRARNHTHEFVRMEYRDRNNQAVKSESGILYSIDANNDEITLKLGNDSFTLPSKDCPQATSIVIIPQE